MYQHTLKILSKNICAWMFCLQICLYTLCMQCPWNVEDSVGSPGAKVTAMCELP